MSAAQLDSAKLDNPKARANGDIEAACPACREQGGDKAGNHLLVKADGRFGCVACPNDTEHRKRIFALIRTKSNEAPRTATTRTPPPPTRNWATPERAAKACEPSGYTLAKVWTYADGSREVLAVARFENGDGKTFRQFQPIADGWTIGAPREKLPLLGKDQLPTSGPVVVVEGEKCFDAAQAIGLPVVCAAGGSSAAAKTDWQPIAGRDVWILPDHDAPGEKYALAAKAILHRLNPSTTIRLVRLPGLPEGGDIVDWIPASRGNKSDAELRDEVEEIAAAAPVEQAQSETAASDSAQVEIHDGDDQPAPAAPWTSITEAQVREAIRNTPLADMVSVLQSVTVPPLPITITLPKALALAGCALSQPMQFDPETEQRRGLELARNVIESAGGQACNVWAVTVAVSGSGKDIGNLAQRLTSEHGLLLGHSGSAEGIADAMTTNGGGLLTLSELGNFLNPHQWEHKAASFLTQAFNAHEARITLSKRNGGDRDIRYCCPSIIANIQPKVLAGATDALLVDSGFLPRFLFSRCDAEQSWRPRADRLDIYPLRQAFNDYLKINARVTVPQDYLADVLAEFTENDAHYPSHYNRLVNEYGPRLAVMLAANPNSPREVIIADEHWQRTEILVRWFYGMAEAVLSQIEESAQVRKLEDRLSRMRAFIKKHRSGVSKRIFSQAFSRGTVAKEREADIKEMEDRGWIAAIQSEDTRGLVLKAVQ